MARLAALWTLAALIVVGCAQGGIDHVVVAHDGCWTGAIVAGGTLRSFSGCGTQVFDVDGGIVSANFQKKEGDGSVLLVQLAHGQKVMKEAQTSAPYGVAGAAQ